MDLYLQMGHGMQDMSVTMIKRWGGGTVLISPVNVAPSKLSALSGKIQKVGGDVLFDPQLFYPKDGNSNLTKYSYWPETGITVDPSGTAKSIMSQLLNLNNEISSSAIIIPSMELKDMNMSYGFEFIRQSATYCSDKSSKEILATICFYPEIFRSKEILEMIIEKLLLMPVSGYYIVPHPSNGEYIISDPLWMIGMLKLLVCLKHAKRKVIVGFANHQSLVYSLAKVDAIASGNFMNTRTFTPKRFMSRKDDDEGRRSVWYYHPNSLNEYKAVYLDVAKQRGFLDSFLPSEEFTNEDSAILFKGALPSSTNYNEPQSFRHYLHCLKIQCKILSKETFDDTFNTYEFMLQSAEQLINEFRARGIRGQNRDFSPAIETNRVAAYTLNEDYGLKTRLEWSSM